MKLALAPKLLIIAGLTILLFAGFVHRHDRTVACKEQIVNGQIYANDCVVLRP